MNKYISLIVGLIVSLSTYSQSQPNIFVKLTPGKDNTATYTSNTRTLSINEDSKKALAIDYLGDIQPHIPNEVTIDEYSRGEQISYQISTTPSGATTINVPIETYSDPKGLNPNIMITYNSMGINGALGMGWNITGLSNIQRVNKTIYYDKEVDGIDVNDKYNAFSLDGIRLILLGETPTEIRYQSERGNIKVIGHLSSSNITYFEAFFPNGQRSIYGFAAGDGKELTYPITKMIDKIGNSINYEYERLNAHYRIKSIKYGIEKQASVEFEYMADRPDPLNVYSAGININIDYLLQSITAKYENLTLKKYELNYTTKGYVSTVDKIECEVRKYGFINPLVFYYGDNKQVKEFQTDSIMMMKGWTYDDYFQLRTSKGKLTNSDGIISFPNRTHYLHYYREGTNFGHSTNQIRNEYDEVNTNNAIVINKQLDNHFFASGNILPMGKGFIDAFLVDINNNFTGDELVKINNTTDGSKETLSFEIYTTVSDIGIPPYTLLDSISYDFTTLVKDAGGRYSIHPKYYFSGDFTGEGRNMILAIATHRPMNREVDGKFYLFDLEKDSYIENTLPFEYNMTFPIYGEKSLDGQTAYNRSDKLFTFDFDGDGKLDLCHISKDGTNIYTFEKDQNDTYNVVLLASYPNMTQQDLNDREVLIGDFNGDGKADLLISQKNDEDKPWEILYSTGNIDQPFVKQDANFPIKTKDKRFFLADMNSDGQTDLVEIVKKEGEYNSELNTHFIRNGEVKEKINTTVPYNTVLLPLHLNENNTIVSLKSYWAKRISFQNNDSKNTLLTGLVNSFGVVSKISYRFINGFEKSNINCLNKYPYTELQGDLMVTAAIQSYMNGQKMKHFTYEYKQPVVHKQGLGFLGFTEFNTKDEISYRYKNQKNDPFEFSVLKEIETETGKENYSYTIDKNKIHPQIKNILLSQRTEQDKLKGTSFNFYYSYDKYGNPITETVNLGDGISSSTVTSKYLNVDNDNHYYIGLLTERKEVKARDNSLVTLSVKNTYNNDLLLSSTASFYNGHKVSEEEYTYDKELNLKESKARPYSSENWLSTTYLYDKYGRVEQETDPMGFSSKYAYDEYGQLLYSENHKGHQTSYVYDDMGRTRRIEHPDGTNSRYMWAECTDADSKLGALYHLQSQEGGGVLKNTYYDASGRIIKERQRRFDNKFLYTSTVYNQNGEVEKTSLPYRDSPKQWNEYTYDYYGRLTSLKYASGKEDKYSYYKLSVTSNIDSVEVTKTYDASGQLVKVTDPAGSIQYSYFADGQPKAIQAPGNIITRFTYDEYGRQTQIDDPSSGITTTEYDEVGNIKKVTDARGKTSSQAYDKFGRVTQKVIDDEISTDYSYNTDGLLISEVSNNNTSKEYSYDDIFRLKSEKETITDNNFLQKDYTYNRSGNLESTSYSSQSGKIGVETYNYSTSQYITSVSFNGKTTWQLLEENDMGMPSKATTGVLDRTYQYDEFGMPTGRIVKKGSRTIQNFEYKFDALTGNLTYRTDKTRNITENFQYDDLNRLTHFGGNEIKYNSKGNIVDHSAVGKYGYNSQKPYAIETLGLYNETIPTRTQETTYNAMLRPATIAENGYFASLEYTPNGDRMKMHLTKDSTDVLTRYYIGGQYEIDKTDAGTKEKLYLDGSPYNASSVLIRENGGDWKIHYICRDYLGSITHLTNDSGDLLQELSYDAWGRLRDPETQELYAIGEEPQLLLDRGYTGHEHLLVFGLINMNARLYDPVIGRFLSPDPYVQDPLFSQNFNRYSYGWNNPLKFTDPSGEIIPLLFAGAALIGGAINWYANGADFSWEGLSHFGVGAVGGMATLAYPAAFPYIAAGMAFASNTIHQGFTQGWDNINYQSAAFDGIISGVTAVGIGKALKIPYVSKGLNKLTGNITSPLVKNLANSYAVGIPLGTTMGAGMAAYNGEDVGVGAWQGFKNSAVVSTMSGLGSAYQYSVNKKVNIFTGNKLGQEIIGSKHSEVLPTQDWIDKDQVDFYKNQIKNNQAIKPIIAYEQNGNIYIEDGHHRYAAYKSLGKEPHIIIHKRGGPVGYSNWSSTSYQK